MKGLLKDFKVTKKTITIFKNFLIGFFLKAKDVRIIIANFNQTIATHMFCHVNAFQRMINYICLKI
jgi:hypothetical protein